jgi:hypothetical protein
MEGKEMKVCMKRVKEDCGHTGTYDFYSMVPFHWPTWRTEMVKTRNGFYKRTFCDICMTYWDDKYKKLK